MQHIYTINGASSKDAYFLYASDQLVSEYYLTGAFWQRYVPGPNRTRRWGDTGNAVTDENNARADIPGKALRGEDVPGKINDPE